VRKLVRGEEVEVLGPKPDDWSGLGDRDGNTLVRYPDGEVGAVSESDIDEKPREYVYHHPLLGRDFRAVELSDTPKGVKVEFIDPTPSMLQDGRTTRTFSRRQAAEHLREVTDG